MDLHDILHETIKEKKSEKVKDAAERKRFEERWEELRDAVIMPRLKEAAEILGAELPSWASAERDNGGVVLNVRQKEYQGSMRWYLRFDKDSPARKVICDSSEESLKESFDIERLTRDEIDRKIREFARAIA